MLKPHLGRAANYHLDGLNPLPTSRNHTRIAISSQDNRHEFLRASFQAFRLPYFAYQRLPQYLHQVSAHKHASFLRRQRRGRCTKQKAVNGGLEAAQVTGIEYQTQRRSRPPKSESPGSIDEVSRKRYTISTYTNTHLV